MTTTWETRDGDLIVAAKNDPDDPDIVLVQTKDFQVIPLNYWRDSVVAGICIVQLQDCDISNEYKPMSIRTNQGV